MLSDFERPENNYSIMGLPEGLKIEATLLSGDELMAVFLETGAYKQSISKKTPILFLRGSKGVGKSTILGRIYQEHAPNVVGIFFKDFYKVIEKRAVESCDGTSDSQLHLCYEKEWKTELWVQIILHLYYEHYQKRLVGFDMGDYLKLRQFLQKKNLPLETPITSQVAEAAFEAKATLEGVAGKLGFEWKKPAPLSEPSEHYEIDNIKTSAINILGATPLFLLIDEIDKIEIWNRSMRASLLGLIEAISSIIRDVNRIHKTGQKIMIRIAIRGDMLRATTMGYVESQKVPKREVDIAWSKENMEELIARQIRVHWNLPPQCISKRKLLFDVFPLTLSKGQDTFEYLSLMARGNPRALFSFLQECIQKAIDRKITYLPEEDEYPPIFVTQDDIASVINSYSADQSQYLKDANEFLFPQLSQVIDFFHQYAGKSSNRGTIKCEDFELALENLIWEDEVLRANIETWPDLGFADPNRILRILYEIGLIGFKKGVRVNYYPTAFSKTKIISIHPTYRSSFLDYTSSKIRSEPIQSVAHAKDLLLSSIDNLTKEIKPSRLTAIPLNSETVDSESAQGNFFDLDIAYAIIRVLWALRWLLKTIIAYGDYPDVHQKYDIEFLARSIENASTDLSENFRIKKHHLTLLALLMNPVDINSSYNQEIFEQEMVFDENVLIYDEISKPIFDWIEQLINDEYKEMADALDKKLVVLRSAIVSDFRID